MAKRKRIWLFSCWFGLGDVRIHEPITVELVVLWGLAWPGSHAAPLRLVAWPYLTLRTEVGDPGVFKQKQRLWPDGDGGWRGKEQASLQIPSSSGGSLVCSAGSCFCWTVSKSFRLVVVWTLCRCWNQEPGGRVLCPPAVWLSEVPLLPEPQYHHQANEASGHSLP